MEHMAFTPAEQPHRAIADVGLPEHTLHCRPGLVIGEISGRDSVAALVKLSRTAEPPPSVANLCILPTVVSTSTEYGDLGEPTRAIHILRSRVASQTRVYDGVRLVSPTLWAALNARFGAEIARRWGTWSPCLACHLYVHLCRVPLAWSLGAVTVATGARDTHRGRLRLSQTPAGIAASHEVMAHAGITLLEPIQHVDDDETLAELAGADWEEHEGRVRCVLSESYLALDGTVLWEPDRHDAYLAEFFVPAGKAVIDAWRAEGIGAHDAATPPDYAALVREVLERGASA
jgi:hypothetical protein